MLISQIISRKSYPISLSANSAQKTYILQEVLIAIKSGKIPKIPFFLQLQQYGIIMM